MTDQKVIEKTMHVPSLRDVRDGRGRRRLTGWQSSGYTRKGGDGAVRQHSGRRLVVMFKRRGGRSPEVGRQKGGEAGPTKRTRLPRRVLCLHLRV